MLWDYLLILLVISLLLCLVGFYKYEYFTTVGYGFTLSGIGVALFTLNIMHAFDATWPNYVMFVLLMLYGLRQSIFVLIREVENGNEKKKKNVPVLTKVVVWLFVSVLSVAQAAPLLFTVEGEYGYYPGFCMWMGMILCVGGLVVAIVTDFQKNRSWEFPISLKDLGALVFWAGILITSLDSLKGLAEWAIAIVSYLAILAVVFLKRKRVAVTE